MKIDVSVQMTPHELREFLGLPDVKPMQEEMLERIRQQMQAGVEGFDPVSLMRPFLAPNLQTIETMQRAFWQAFATGAGSEGKAKK